MNKRCLPLFRRIFAMGVWQLLAGTTAAIAGATSEPATSTQIKLAADDWVVGLCVFDSIRFDPSGRLAVDLAVQTLGKAIVEMTEHRNSSAERKIAVDAAMKASRKTAEDNLIAKRTSRDSIFFQGLPVWKIGDEQAKADDSLKQAINQLASQSDTVFIAPDSRRIVLAKENQNGALLLAPNTGAEKKYCQEKDLDALILGWAEPYYERVLIGVSLYVAAEDTMAYQEEIMYSPEDRELSIASLAGRLAVAALGERPAALTVVAPGAEIAVDGRFRGTGQAGPLERPSGSARLELSAEGYIDNRIDLDLDSGFLTTIASDLTPIQYNEVELVASVPEFESVDGVRLRSGAQYLGNAPMTVTVASGKTANFMAESDFGTTKMVVGSDDVSFRFDLQAESQVPDAVGQGRKAFYAAFGRFSIMLPIAFLASGIAKSYRERTLTDRSSEAVLTAGRMEYVGALLWTTAGVFIAEAVYRFYGYINQASASFPVQKTIADKGQK